LDAKASIKFRKILPTSRIIAFEANPLLFDRMFQKPHIIKNRIEVFHNAVWNQDGFVNFYVEDFLNEDDCRKGMSSTRLREKGKILGQTKVEIKSIRLDTFFLDLDDNISDIALWIDVEGASYEVLEGIKKIKNKVQFVHAEVETKESWPKQMLKSDVIFLMKKFNFVPLTEGFNEEQTDIVFMNKTTWTQHRFKYNVIIFTALCLTLILKLWGKKILRVLRKFQFDNSKYRKFRKI